MLRRGCVYWAALDKRRRGLLVSAEGRNDKARDVIVIPASRVMREGPWHVRLKKGEGGLTAPSVLLFEQITTSTKDCSDTTLLGGRLSSVRICEVARAVLRAIGVP